MTQISFKSAGVSARTLNLTGPTAIQPTGIPAGVIAPSVKGPAYVPVTVATTPDFNATFGLPSDDFNFGPLATSEWLRTQGSATYVRVLGVGNGEARSSASPNAGRVVNAGYVVGDQQPQNSLDGRLDTNPYANNGGVLGRTYFLGCFMSQSVNSTFLTDAGKPAQGVPVVRGVLMAASGVLLTLSTSIGDSDIDSSVLGTEGTKKGNVTGSLNLVDSRQEFVMLLNGHLGTDQNYPFAVTASFDINAPNYFGNMFNTDPYKLEQAGHVLYADYQIHPSLAVPTGSGIVDPALGATGVENIAFLVTGALDRNLGSTTVPNYENFEDRFRTAKSPWVTSQKFGGFAENLFRIHSLDDGEYPNNKVKLSVENIAPSTSGDGYGTFDVVVRDFNDNDKAKVILEAFRGVNLNPSSPKFVAQVIGDYNTYLDLDQSAGNQKLVTNGDYPSRSSYIRVEMAGKVSNGELDPSALPFGFRGVPHLVTSGSALAPFADSGYFQTSANVFAGTVQMPVPLRENLNRGSDGSLTADKGLYWGIQFEQKVSATEPNQSTVLDPTLESFTKYFPDFQTGYVNFVEYDNEGAPDGANGVVDADRFNNNAFTLGNVKVSYLSGSGNPDTVNVTNWSYVRNGNIANDTVALTRALEVDDLTDPNVRRLAKFNLCLQGGFDGVRIFDKNTKVMNDLAIYQEMQHVNRGTSNGATVNSYGKALEIISDNTEVDVQLLVIPGVRHPIITDRALQITEERFDALYIMDIQQMDVNNVLVSSSNQIVSVPNTIVNYDDRGLNSSFGATYFPDVSIRDSANGTTRQVPPSVAVLGAFGKNDSVGYPWFAPAGFVRGALDTTEEASVQLSRQNLDDLYESRINPLTSFPGSGGVVVWGQKTTLNRDSALERVNVRRLLIDLRRQVKRISNRIVFEQGLPETLERFSNLVTPILKRVQDQNGVDRYLVKIDSSTTTQADFENKTIRGKIYIQPTRTLEFLSIDFSINNPGTI